MYPQSYFDAIILVTGSRWDQDYSSASISLAKELSKTHTVFFIDNPFTLKDIIKGWRTSQIRQRIQALIFGRSIYRQIESGNRNWIAVTPHVVLPINWLPEGNFYDLLCSFNNWIFIQSIRRVIKDYNLKNFIYFNSYNPFYGYYLPRDIKPVINLYQSRDNIRESEYVNRHGPQLELKAARAATIRLATSTDLVNRLSTNEHPFIFFPNAADTKLFGSASISADKIPDELKNLKKPIIGYIGNICLRLDYDLIYEIATRFKDYTLLMVGPRNDLNQHSYNFDKLPNVVFTGGKKIIELPKYLSMIDCCILPFKKNALTRSIYPLKINEYLAGGKPVVSTDFSTDIESFSHVIYISSTRNDFLNKVTQALSEDNSEKREKRIMEVQQNSWTARVSLFWQLIDKTRSI